MYAFMYVHIYIYIYMCTYINAYMYLYNSFNIFRSYLIFDILDFIYLFPLTGVADSVSWLCWQRIGFCGQGQSLCTRKMVFVVSRGRPLSPIFAFKNKISILNFASDTYIYICNAQYEN